MRVRSMHDLAAAARGRRLNLGLSQAELARRVGASRKWINEFEAGKPTAEIGIVLRVVEELGLELDVGERGAAPPAASESLDLDALLDTYRDA